MTLFPVVPVPGSYHMEGAGVENILIIWKGRALKVKMQKVKCSLFFMIPGTDSCVPPAYVP